MTRVKICGARSESEARMAALAGADAVGVLVGQAHRSDDFVDAERARKIFASLPPFVAGVLVTHYSDLEPIVELVDAVRCSALQLHAEIAPALAARIREVLVPAKLIVLVSVFDESAVARASLLSGVADALILDSVDETADRVGGTGRTHDWSISARIVREVDCPVVLAGGLDPSNVADAIRAVRPWAVDANSGLRGADGRRSPAQLHQFVECARNAHSM